MKYFHEYDILNQSEVGKGGESGGVGVGMGGGGGVRPYSPKILGHLDSGADSVEVHGV